MLEVVGGFFLLTGLLFVIRDTKRRSGRWGVNLTPLECPRCGAMGSALRIPKRMTHALWGGRTCNTCHCTIDKWGREAAA